ncbi:MAG: hypothetical protein AAGC70_15055, partial [Pseudomonadota bacterium]
SGPARARRNAAGRSRGLGTSYQDSPRSSSEPANSANESLLSLTGYSGLRPGPIEMANTPSRQIKCPTRVHPRWGGRAATRRAAFAAWGA